MIIEKLHSEREKAKKNKNELESYAIKIIMNSFFGVLASPNCRYFNMDVANAITYFGQFIIKLTAKEIEKMGYPVIYSDTDSVFVHTKLKSYEESEKIGKTIQERINQFYQQYVKENYNRKSFLEIQFDKHFISLMIPRIRLKEREEGKQIGAKKRYAGLIIKDGKEEIAAVGLEAIRGDWTDAAQEFQIELLRKVFKDEPYEEFIKSYIKDLKSGKLDSKLIYRKSIRKSLDQYTKTTPPHVKAARKLKTLDSPVIEYYITTDGPEPIHFLKHKIDYDHYIEKQIRPIAEQILSLFDKNFDDLSKKSKQTKLF
jgi:DNA polymerase-2